MTPFFDETAMVLSGFDKIISPERCSSMKKTPLLLFDSGFPVFSLGSVPVLCQYSSVEIKKLIFFSLIFIATFEE
jgi:hypothetical protein